MASPQKENGSTQIAHEILEALVGAGLNGTELACVLLIIRKTYGWQKKEDQISLSQFTEKIPCSRQAVINALNNLKLVNIIRLVKKGNSKISANTYAFNKNYDEWQLVKKARLVKKRNPTSKENRFQLVKKPLHTIDNLQKKEQKKYIYGTEFEKLTYSQKGIMFKRINSYVEKFSEQPSIVQINHWIETEILKTNNEKNKS